MPLEVAIVGAGFARTALLPALAHVDDATVVALASARQESARSAADAFGVPAAYDDWQEMLARHAPDLVCIATPTHTHAPIALAALDAGAHVLCEKPMALDGQEAARMLERAEAAGRIHMIDHELRFNPNRRRIRDLVRDGAIGTVRHVQVVNVTSIHGDASSRRKGDWLSSAQLGGGRLGANGSHQIDLLRWWFGEVASVSGHLETLVPARTDPDSGEAWTATADDFANFTLRMAGGVVATVLLSGVARTPVGNHVHVFGSGGSILLADRDERVLVTWPDGTVEDASRDDPHAELPGIQQRVWNVSVVGLLRELTGAIREGRPLREGATFADGVRCQEVMDAVRRSSAERRWIDVAPARKGAHA